MMRVYAAMTQKERELISERTRAALSAAKARGAVFLVGDRGYRPPAPPCAAAASMSRAERADQTAHRLWFEIDLLRVDGVSTLSGRRMR